MPRSYLTNPILVLATALAGGALALGLWSWQQWATNMAATQDNGPVDATVLPEPRPLPRVRLINQDGATVSTHGLFDRSSLWFFGFTHCPDVCPNTLSLLAAVKQALSDAPDARNLQVVFVSVDPQRDTPEQLAAYVRYFDKSFIGLTGSRDAIDTLTGGLYLPYSLDKPDADGSYNVEHSAVLVLVDPDGAARAYFTPPHDRKNLVNDLRYLIRAEG